MSHPTTRAISAILNRIDTFGAKLPETLRTDFNERVTHANLLGDWTAPTRGFIATAADTIAAGRNPDTDPDVIAGAVNELLNTHQRAIQAAGVEALADLTRTHLDTLIGALDHGYQKHVVKPLKAAIDTLTNMGVTSPDTPSDEVLRRGGTAADAWAAMRKANDLNNAIFGELATLRSHINITTAEPVFTYADPNGLPIHDIRKLGNKPHPWTVLTAGMTLGLASPKAAAQRAATAGETFAASQRANAAAAQQAYAAPWKHTA